MSSRLIGCVRNLPIKRKILNWSNWFYKLQVCLVVVVTLEAHFYKKYITTLFKMDGADLSKDPI